MVRALIILTLSAWAHTAGARCMDTALERLGLPVHAREVAFLEPTGTLTRSWQLDEARCVSVLALATRPHARVDAVLRAESGQDLSQDGSDTPHAFVRFCGAAGLRLYWTLSVSAASEVEFVALEGAPARVPDWGRDVGECFSSAPGMRIADPELGAPPPASSAEQRLERRAGALRERGYSVDRREREEFSERLDREVDLEGGRCYALWAVPEIGAVDTTLVAPDGRELAADRRRDVDGGIGYCPTMSGRFTWTIHDAGGVEAVHLLFVSAATPPEIPAGLVGPATRAFVEQSGNGRLVTLGWIHLEEGESIVLPLPSSSGSCRTVVAIPAEEAWARSGLSLQLLGAEDELLGSGTRAPRRGGVAKVHECGSGARAVRTVARRGRGRVWLGVQAP